jgi:hypothetical protein
MALLLIQSPVRWVLGTPIPGVSLEHLILVQWLYETDYTGRI